MEPIAILSLIIAGLLIASAAMAIGIGGGILWTPLLILGIATSDLAPVSNQLGEIWLISGELEGEYVLSPEAAGILGRRLPATETDLDLFGAAVLLAETQQAGRLQLVVSAPLGKRHFPDLGAVLIYDLE